MNNTHKDATADDARLLARQAISRGIREIVERTHGADGFDTRPIFPGAQSMTSVPKGEAGIRAALMLRDRAAAELVDLIGEARAAGASWERVAEILGYTGDDASGNSPGERAFYFVAPDEPGSFRPSYAAWRCSTCSGLVTDRGPFNGHPEDNESGHAEGCGRLAAEVAEYQRSLDEE